MLYAAAQLLGKPYPHPKDGQNLNNKQLDKFIGSYDFEGYRQIKIHDNKVIYINRNSIINGVKTSNQVPAENTEITLNKSILESYTGDYKFEQFVMAITLEDGKLYAQPDDGDKLLIAAKSNNQFFIKEIGAEIEFNNDNNEPSINIVQEGNLMIGLKI